MRAMTAPALATRPRRNFPAVPPRVYVYLALYFASTWGVILALVAGALPGAVLWIAALATFTIAPLLLLLIRGGFGAAPGSAYRLWVLRPFWYVQLMLPFVALAGALGAAIGTPFGGALIGGRVVAGTVAALLAMFLLAGYIGSRRLVVRNVTAEIAGLPAGLDGTRIVQLSDLHIGPHLPAARFERIVSTVQSLEPDLIAITGDLVDDHAEDTDRYADAVGMLDAPLGVYVIAGNHDVYAGWNNVARRLRERVGSHVLVNQSRTVTRGGAMLAVAGTGDPAAGNDAANGGVDIAATLAQVPAGVPVLALAHNPALWPALAGRGVALTLSGHTHGGQVRIPGRPVLVRMSRYRLDEGRFEHDGAHIVVSRGLGVSGIPLRVACAPEALLVTLRLK